MIQSQKRAAKYQDKPQLSQDAQRKAENIRQARTERVEKIKQQQAAARKELDEEGSKIWTDYREKRQAAYDKYKPLIAEARAGRIPSMGLDLKPDASLFPKSPEWVQLARAMKPVLGHLPMAKYREFITAGQALIPHNLPNGKSRIFNWSKEAATKADLQPLKQQKVVQPGRPWLQRRERVQQLKLARHAELAEVSLEHQRKTEALENAYIKLNEDNAVDWKTLKDQSAKMWANWREDFKSPDNKRDYKDWNRLVFEPRKDSPRLRPEFNKPVTKAVSRAKSEEERKNTVPEFRIVTELTDNSWQSGKIEPGNFTYHAKVFDRPSEFGIGGGIISKLEVRDSQNNPVVNFERGWDLKPAGAVEQAIIKAIVGRYNGLVPQNALEERQGIPGTEMPSAAPNKDRPPKQRYRYEVDPEEAQRQFAEAIREFGLDLKGQMPKMDGKFHPVPLIGQHGNKKSGAYRGYLDGRPAGSIRNHKTSETISWKADGERKPISREQGLLFDKRAAQKKQERDAVIIARHDNAALQAKVRLEQTRVASPNHPYLKAKGVDRHGIRQDVEGNLLIARQNIDGKIRSYQTIFKDGSKRYQKDGEINGTFYVIGDPDKAGRIYVAEGFATGASVNEATGACVFVAFDKGNLRNVAEAIREKYPEREICIAGDSDQWSFTQKGYEEAGRPDKDRIPGDDPRWKEWRDKGYLENGGLIAAYGAAEAVGGSVIMPAINADDPAKAKDWNDISLRDGLSAVASQFPSTEQDNEREGNELTYEPGGYEMD